MNQRDNDWLLHIRYMGETAGGEQVGDEDEKRAPKILEKQELQAKVGRAGPPMPSVPHPGGLCGLGGPSLSKPLFLGDTDLRQVPTQASAQHFLPTLLPQPLSSCRVSPRPQP